MTRFASGFFATAALGAFVIGLMTGPAPLAPCETEDSPGPCVWDATTQGNGHGRSFYVTADQRVIYLP